MPNADRNLRSRLITWAFAIYAIATLTSMAAMSIGTALLLAAMLIGAGGPRPYWKKLRESASLPEAKTYLWISAALALAILASLVSALVQPMGYGGQFVQVAIGSEPWKLWYLIWPVLLLAGLSLLNEGQRYSVIRAWLLAFLAFSVVGVIQYFTGWPRPQQIPGMPRFHATMFLGHHLSVASIFIFPFFAALDAARNPVLRSKLKLPLWGALGIILVGAVTLFLTYSRTLWFAVPVALAVWFFWSVPRKWGIAFFVALVFAAVFAAQHPVIQNRFRDSYGLTTRQELWKANLEFVQQRPLLGVGWRHNHELAHYYFQSKLGPGAEYFAGHAHNLFLDMLAGTGIIGALAFLAWNVLPLVWAIRLRKESGFFAKGLVCAWLAFHLNGLTQVNFWEAKVTHQLVWMVAWTLLFLRFNRGARA